MKLIFCTVCNDVLRLYRHRRTCECGAAWGHYLEDNLHAAIGASAIPLGFRNDEFARDLRARPAVGLGSRFAAFVIPEKCDTVTLVD